MAKYVGKRVVPKLCGAWNGHTKYEMLSVVLDESTGDSYVARKEVPAGTGLNQTDYWALSSRYSQQYQNLSDQLTATLRQVRADNDATETEIKADNASTKQYVDEHLRETSEELADAVNQAVREMSQSKEQFDSVTEILSSRMESIVGGATTDTEILDARVSDQGYEYENLGTHIRDLESSVREGYSWTDITADYEADDGWRSASGVYSVGIYTHRVIPCIRGERYRITSLVPNSGIPFAIFLDADGRHFSNAINPPSDISEFALKRREIVVPAGAASLIVNCVNPYLMVVEKECLKWSDAVGAFFSEEYEPEFENGKLWTVVNQTGQVVMTTASDYTWAVADMILLPKGSEIECDVPLKHRIFEYDLSGNAVSEIAGWSTGKYVAPQDEYIRLSLQGYNSSLPGVPERDVTIYRTLTEGVIAHLRETVKTVENRIAEEDAKVNTFDERISALEESYDESNVFHDEVLACRSTLETKCTGKSLVFAVVTDSHVSDASFDRWKVTASNIRRVNKAYPLDGVVHLGDMVNGNLPKAQSLALIREIRNDLLKASTNTMMVTGNHDTNTFFGDNMDDPISEAEMYSIWGRMNETAVHRPSNKMYWYQDYDAVRVIYLLSSLGDGTHGGRGDNWGYPLEEINWVRDVALDTDKQVLFFSHMAMTSGWVGSKALSLPQNGDALKAVINDFISNGGTVIGLIHGHTHYDYIGDNGTFHEISVGCNMITSNTADQAADPEVAPTGAIVPGRVNGTPSQDLWELVVILPDARKVELIRFGAGPDRSIDY